jgi:ribosomal protein L35AE/L33A
MFLKIITCAAFGEKYTAVILHFQEGRRLVAGRELLIKLIDIPAKHENKLG